MQKVSPYKEDFIGLEGRVYLNTGAEGLLLKRCVEALNAYVRAKSLGAQGRESLYLADQDGKCKVAELLNASPEEIAFLPNASDGINMLCNSIRWRPGDEVVISDLEFPSNVLPWIKLAKSGVKVNIVRSHNWQLAEEDIAKCINTKTRVVSMSHVSYMTGFRINISAVGKMAHSVGALFCVDATQSLGRIPVLTDEVDYLVCSSYKWLMGPHGIGIVYCDRELLRSLEPCFIGWWSVPNIFTEDRFERYELKPTAAKMELGMPNFPTLYGLSDAISYLLEIGVEKIESDLEALCDYLIKELQKLHVPLITPMDSEKRAGLISFLQEGGERIAWELARKSIHVWGGDGRVRVSVHLYNDLNDIELLLEHLQRLLKA